ncbi:MAG: hypothetical protein M1831_000211 [Alyxoria varia]|nr:MAG: hypothetical protein M1831_000211 [Alyxoria varia]
MSFSEDSVKAKLSALNETQESIVTTGQWIMFHRRYAPQTAQVWFQKLKESPVPKRLTLVYLANETIQQSKARKKEDFLLAFSPLIAEGTAVAYKSAPSEIQSKLRHVVDVWRQREIFDPSVQLAIETRLKEIDKARPAKKPLMGGSIFSSGDGPAISQELETLAKYQTTLSKSQLALKPALTSANTEFDALTSGQQPTPSPPVHASRLTGLLKSLASAEDAASESMKARKALIAELEKLVDENQAETAREESLCEDIRSKKSTIDAKKREVEDGIMRGLSAEDNAAAAASIPAGHGGINGEGLPDRPEVEPLTPPPIESDSPPLGDVVDESLIEPPTYDGKDGSHTPTEPPPSSSLWTDLQDPSLASMNVQTTIAPPPIAPNANTGSPTGDIDVHALRERMKHKKRKTSHNSNDEFEGAFANENAMEGLDAEVVGMLK